MKSKKHSDILSSISIILLKPETPENVGFVARSMKNFGLHNLLLISPLYDHPSEAAIRTSMHAKEILASAEVLPYSSFHSLKSRFDMIVGTTSLLGTDYNVPRTTLQPDELPARLNPDVKTAIVFGNEGTGLSNEELRSCDIAITIPTSKEYPAMNLSHAAAVLFYELYNSYGKDKINSHLKKATRKELDIIHGLMQGIIASTEFSTEEKRNTQVLVWKKLMEQASLTKREAFAVMGLLRKLKN